MQENTTPKLWIFFALSLLGIIVPILLILGMSGILHILVLLMMAAMLFITARTGRKQVLSRRTGSGRDTVFFALFALFFCLSTVISLLDFRIWHCAVLHGAFMIPGVLLAVVSYFLTFQSMTADSRHAHEKYGEPLPEEEVHYGPYDLIRHPFMLAACFLMLSIPLIFASGLGFAAAVPGVILILVRTSLEDDFRYREYEWYIDYTNSITYRILPFIW